MCGYRDSFFLYLNHYSFLNGLWAQVGSSQVSLVAKLKLPNAIGRGFVILSTVCGHFYVYF